MRTWTRVSVCVTRRYVSQSLTLRPFRPGCMRNEASAPFLAPFLFSPSTSPPTPPIPAMEDGEDPSYDPYPDPPPPFVDDADGVDRVSNSPCGPTRRGNPRANTLTTAGFAYVNILLPPSLLDAPIEIGPPNSIPRISIPRKEMLSLLQRYEFFTLCSRTELPNDIIKRSCKLSDIDWIILFIKTFTSFVASFGS